MTVDSTVWMDIHNEISHKFTRLDEKMYNKLFIKNDLERCLLAVY